MTGHGDRDRDRVALHLVELRVDQPLFERRDDDDERSGERPADDDDQRQRQPDPDPTGQAHASRKQYPAPRTVRISFGSPGVLLDLLAQMPDVDVDRARLAVVRTAVQSLQQLPA